MKKVYILTDEEMNIVGVVSDVQYKNSLELQDEIARLDDQDLLLFIDIDEYKLIDDVEPLMRKLKATARKYSDFGGV